MIKVETIPAFSDNYIWAMCQTDTKKAVIIDPGSFDEVDSFLQANELSLDAILITHHHPDHTGGVKKLKAKYQDLVVYGSTSSNLDIFDERLSENDSVSLLGIELNTLEVPGHTLDHIAFYSPESDQLEQPILFCGDTLFSAGCGRLFEGTAEQMFESMLKIQALPDTTKVYCAHEYTLANLDFAISLMPNNKELQRYVEHCQHLRSNNTSTIPANLGQEKQINPFLRWRDPELQRNIKQQYPKIELNDVSVFAATRKAKDSF